MEENRKTYYANLAFRTKSSIPALRDEKLRKAVISSFSEYLELNGFKNYDLSFGYNFIYLVLKFPRPVEWDSLAVSLVAHVNLNARNIFGVVGLFEEEYILTVGKFLTSKMLLSFTEGR